MNDLFSTVMLSITTLASLSSAATTLVSALRKRKVDNVKEQLEIVNKKNLSARKELLDVYKNIEGLLKIEADLTAQLGKAKRAVRSEASLDRHVEPKRVATRIKELSEELSVAKVL